MVYVNQYYLTVVLLLTYSGDAYGVWFMLITPYGCLSSVLGRQCGYDLVKEQVVYWYLLFRDEMAFSCDILVCTWIPSMQEEYKYVLI